MTHVFRTNGSLRRAVFYMAFWAFIGFSVNPASIRPSLADVPVPAKKPNFHESNEDYLLVRAFKSVFGSYDDEEGADYGAPVPQEKPQARRLTGVKTSHAVTMEPYVQEEMPDGEMRVQDRLKYKTVFALQAAGDITEAQKIFSEIDDLRLRGHVLYQRYMHPTAYVSQFAELQDWLKHYADHPGADKIYALAQAKKPGSFKEVLTTPVKSQKIRQRQEPTMRYAQVYRSKNQRSADQKAKAKQFKAQIARLISQKDLSGAVKQIKASNVIDEHEKGILKAKIATRYMHMSELDKAYDVAVSVKKSAKVSAPKASWAAGLATWKRLDYKESATHFEHVASSPYSSSWTSSAGAFWAARAHMRMGNVKDVSIWLNHAAKYPRTFYGLLATRSLGHDFDFNWQKPKFTKDHEALLIQIPAAKRAILLVSTGQEHLAVAELLRLRPQNEEMRDALLAYASQANLPGVAMRLGGGYDEANEGYFDAALYPATPWSPQSGYRVDPALIHAIMRQESTFDPSAESVSGARGLMQLMPTTASYIGGSKSWESKEGQHKLLNPAVNLELGQKYLVDLLGQSHIRGDLLAMLIAYNAGPGNLRKWKRQWSDVEDQLLFIELIQAGETRVYVERVLANYWIYRLREGLETPSLEALAEGREARYAVLEDGMKVALN